jgi:hypothetical protein
MMEKAIERAEEIAQARQASAIDAVVATIRAVLPGEAVEIDGTDVTVTGRGLLTRWLASADLRFLSSARP